MKNCHNDILSYHDEGVRLSGEDRSKMRKHRDTNRERLKTGLKRDGEPAPIDNRSQGSYAMRTMIQDRTNDYDIDDGVYFKKSDLKGPRDGDRQPNSIKEMIRKAVHSDAFKQPPDVRTNCVRVHYNEGYHVDLPVYRTFEVDGETIHELAGTEWKRSDPTKVTAWFCNENTAQSPDSTNGRQLNRITKLIKKFSKSRESWKDKTASGFIISKLVTEKYSANESREDEALYECMKSIRDRLEWDLEVKHPVLDEYLTNGPEDAKTKHLKNKLTEAINNLAVLFSENCSQEDARKAWDKVFNTDYFSNLPADDGSESKAKATAFSILSSGENQEVVDKDGGGNYADDR